MVEGSQTFFLEPESILSFSCVKQEEYIWVFHVYSKVDNGGNEGVAAQIFQERSNLLQSSCHIVPSS